MHSAQPTGGQRQNERPACTNSDPIVHDVSLSSTGSALSVLQRRAHEELQQGGVSRTAQKATSKKKLVRKIVSYKFTQRSKDNSGQKLLKYNESPRDIEICYVDKEVVYILKDVLNFIKDGYITPLPERLEKYYNNNKHKLEGGE